MKCSIVELATTAPGTTEADALGFHRVWFAEHHATPSNASTIRKSS